MNHSMINALYERPKFIPMGGSYHAQSSMIAHLLGRPSSPGHSTGLGRTGHEFDPASLDPPPLQAQASVLVAQAAVRNALGHTHDDGPKLMLLSHHEVSHIEWVYRSLSGLQIAPNRSKIFKANTTMGPNRTLSDQMAAAQKAQSMPASALLPGMSYAPGYSPS